MNHEAGRRLYSPHPTNSVFSWSREEKNYFETWNVVIEGSRPIAAWLVRVCRTHLELHREISPASRISPAESSSKGVNITCDKSRRRFGFFFYSIWNLIFPPPPYTCFRLKSGRAFQFDVRVDFQASASAFLLVYDFISPFRNDNYGISFPKAKSFSDGERASAEMKNLIAVNHAAFSIFNAFSTPSSSRIGTVGWLAFCGAAWEEKLILDFHEKSLSRLTSLPRWELKTVFQPL